MVQSAIRTADDTESMKNLYQSARLLRQRIEQFTKTVKTSSSIVVTSTLEDVPVELYTIVRLIMAGPANKLQKEVRTTIVDRGAKPFEPKPDVWFQIQETSHVQAE